MGEENQILDFTGLAHITVHTIFHRSEYFCQNHTISQNHASDLTISESFIYINKKSKQSAALTVGSGAIVKTNRVLG